MKYRLKVRQTILWTGEITAKDADAAENKAINLFEDLTLDAIEKNFVYKDEDVEVIDIEEYVNDDV